MGRLFEDLKSNVSVAISIPAILCFIQFVYEIYEIIKTHELTSDILSQLVSSANGFESVVLFTIMIALKNKKK